MNYDRLKALEYAEKYYLKGNLDNKEYRNFDREDDNKSTDCANFVSQCLHAGGIEKIYVGSQSNQWNPKVSNWNGAQSLRLFIKKGNHIKYEFLPSVDGMKAGDLVFRLENKNDTKNNREAKHVAIVRCIEGNKIFVYQHGQKVKSIGEKAYADYAKTIWKTKPEDTIFCHICDNNNYINANNYISRYGNITLKKGSKGQFVKNMQEDINKINYDCGVADGIFGNNTITAVKKFQKNYGLKSDGLFGRNSKETLYNILYNN